MGGIDSESAITNQGGVPAGLAKALADFPPAGIPFRFMLRTDAPYGIYMDTGSAWINIADVSPGLLSLAPIGNVPNADGASLSGPVLMLQPANENFGGLMTAIAQVMAGTKTWNGVANFLNTVNIMHASGGADLTLIRSLIGNEAYVEYYTAVSQIWRVGMQPGSDNFVFENMITPGNAIRIDVLTNVVTFLAGIVGTTAVFSSTISAFNFSGSSSGTNTGDQTDITGNAATATALQTARLIQGVSFDGTANIDLINGTGFVKAAGTALSYDNNTYLTTADAIATYLSIASAAATYLPFTAGSGAPLSGKLYIATPGDASISTQRSGGKRWECGSDASAFIISNRTDGITPVQFLNNGDIVFGSGTALFGILAGSGDRIVLANASGEISASNALPNGTTATTQTPGDNSNNVATTAYVDAAVSMRCLYSATADVVLAADVTTTSMIGTGVGSLVIAANTMQVGSTYRLKMDGRYSTPAAVAGLINVNLTIGGTDYAGTVINPLQVVSLLNVAWAIDVTFTIRAIGGSGMAQAGGSVVYGIAAAGSAAGVDKIAGGASIDTTIANTFDITFGWSNNTAGNSATSLTFTLEQLR